jgi:sugar lactone lactonase YvrE
MRIFALFMTSILIYFLFWPIDIDPISWDSGLVTIEPPENITKFNILKSTNGHGPEGVAISKGGRVFGGLENGKIISMTQEGGDEKIHFTIDARPLGMIFDENEVLWIASSEGCLLKSWPTEGRFRKVLCRVDGIPIAFPNDLALGRKGEIYFSDTSNKALDRLALDLLESRGRGRLIKYEPKSNKSTVLMQGLHFANGVAISKDMSKIYVAETSRNRIISLNLNTGERVVLIDDLPGYPDGISQRDGVVWIALVDKRSKMLDGFSRWPLVRKALARMPAFLVPYPPMQARIMGISESGRILRDFNDPEGVSFRRPSSVLIWNDHLFVGSLVESGFGIIKL